MQIYSPVEASLVDNIRLGKVATQLQVGCIGDVVQGEVLADVVVLREQGHCS